MGREEMNSCFIISDSFLIWFSHCSWKRIISINNTQHVHPSSYFLANHLAPYFITETEVMGELSHFPTMKSTYLHLNSSSSRSNLLLSSLVLTFLHLLPSLLLVSLVSKLSTLLTRYEVLSFLLFHRHTKLILLSSLCTWGCLSLKLSSLRYS